MNLQKSILKPQFHFLIIGYWVWSGLNITLHMWRYLKDLWQQICSLWTSKENVGGKSE